MTRSLFIAFASALFSVLPAYAQTTPEEYRAREIGAQLRCVVCQNQSIEESDAQLAEDMRLVVREQVEAGASNEAVIAYMRNNYGDYVLLKPPVQANTYVLWFLPFALALFGLLWFGLRSKGKSQTVEVQAALSAEDQAILDDLMREDT
jgi:cytochrome c-type biogenesis protein CcmH